MLDKNLLKVLNVKLEVSQVEEIASNWNVDTMELINLANGLSNNYPVTFEFLIKTLEATTNNVLSLNFSLKDILCLITELKPICTLYDETKTYDEEATIRYVSNYVNNILARGGSVKGIETKDLKSFGIYMLGKVDYIKSRISDKDSAFNFQF